MTSQDVIEALQSISDEHRAEIGARFFKTGPGEYGEGDLFLGVTVPQTRKIAAKFRDLSFYEIEQLITNAFHEVRLTALHILVDKYKRGDDATKKQVFDFYGHHLDYINSWDLVDTSAPYIVGPHLFKLDRSWLYELAASNELWRQRVSIISTFYFIRQEDYDDTLKISEMLLNHPHDLIHKAVGWMLREVGNRDIEVEEEFLTQHYANMPRTILRYAIEKFPEKLRQDYLKGRI